jgi:hypothetical protein
MTKNVMGSGNFRNVVNGMMVFKISYNKGLVSVHLIQLVQDKTGRRKQWYGTFRFHKMAGIS